MAVQWSLEKSKYWTLGCKSLHVFVDHKPLLGLLGKKRLEDIDNVRLGRLAEKISSWTFTLFHISGKKNVGPDVLSRFPWGQEASVCELEAELCSLAVSQSLPQSELETKSREDELMTVLEELLGRSSSDSKEWRQKGVHEYFSFRKSLCVIGDLLGMKDRVVVPVCMRQGVLQQLHSAHQGVAKMKERASADYWWPGISADIERLRENCKSCE